MQAKYRKYLEEINENPEDAWCCLEDPEMLLMRGSNALEMLEWLLGYAKTMQLGDDYNALVFADPTGNGLIASGKDLPET